MPKYSVKTPKSLLRKLKGNPVVVDGFSLFAEPLLHFDLILKCDRPDLKNTPICGMLREDRPKSTRTIFINRKGCHPYQKKGLISSGAFGRVFQTCCKHKCEYVTKRSKFTRSFTVNSFNREVVFQQLASRYGIAPPIVESFTTKNYGAIVMKNVKGEVLNKEHIRNSQSKSRRKKASQLAREVGRVLLQLHSLGFAHTDTHDFNIIRDESSGKLQLIDFGLARPFTGQLSQDIELIQRDYDNTLIYRPDGVPEDITAEEKEYSTAYYEALEHYFRRDVKKYARYIQRLEQK